MGFSLGFGCADAFQLGWFENLITAIGVFQDNARAPARAKLENRDDVAGEVRILAAGR
jgi:hypothetical protein